MSDTIVAAADESAPDPLLVPRPSGVADESPAGAGASGAGRDQQNMGDALRRRDRDQYLHVRQWQKAPQRIARARQLSMILDIPVQSIRRTV